MDDLTLLARALPQHHEIFGKPTVAEALEALQARIARLQQEKSQQEIKKNVVILYELFNAKLPDDLIIWMAAMTGNAKYHNEFDSIKIAVKQATLLQKEELLLKSLPPVATIIHHHGLLHSLLNNNKEEKSPQQQHEFDKLYGLIEFKKP